MTIKDLNFCNIQEESHRRATQKLVAIFSANGTLYVEQSQSNPVYLIITFKIDSGYQSNPVYLIITFKIDSGSQFSFPKQEGRNQKIYGSTNITYKLINHMVSYIFKEL